MYAAAQALFGTLFMYAVMWNEFTPAAISLFIAVIIRGRAIDDAAPFNDGRIVQCGPFWQIQVKNTIKVKE